MKKNESGMNQVRFWLLMWMLGLAGQFCWNIENQWFNTFVYAKIAKDSSIVTLMVITSALVTTFSTFLFGTLSDRLGTRRRFVSFGYIVWGLCTILFGFTEFIGKGAVGVGARVSMWAAVMVILADDVMSFFGSMGNDSGYNACNQRLPPIYSSVSPPKRRLRPAKSSIARASSSGVKSGQCVSVK